MNELAVLFRTAQLFAHNCHNLTKGVTFFSDHSFFGDAYAAYESAYDAVIERMIGLDMSVNLGTVTAVAGEKAGKMTLPGMDAVRMFSAILELEKEICVAVKTYAASTTDGTQNLIQGLADESEIRQYKLKQRIR